MKTIFSRRHFVYSSALTAALVSKRGAGALVVPPPPSGGTSPIQLGLASYTFRNFRRAQMIGFMKQLNVSALNGKDVKDHFPMDPQAETAALSDYAAAGINLHAGGVVSFAKPDEADIRNKFEYAKRAGIPVIVGGDPTNETLPLVEKFVKEYDIRVAIHNHGPEDKLWPSPLEVLEVVKTMDPRMGCCIDVGHTARAGIDPVLAIQKAGPRVFNVHMKDLTDFKNKDSQVAVGDGIMPVRKIFEALIANHYQGFVDLEYEVHPDDPMPGVSNSFAYMRGMLAGMQG
jgi:sugar phosphate isomerase/epimerase